MEPIAALEYERRGQLMNVIASSNETTMTSIRQILSSIGEDPEENGVDLMAASAEVVATLHHFATRGRDGLWKPTPQDHAERWRAYRSRVPSETRRDVTWLKTRGGATSRRFAERLKDIKREAWMWFGHVYVKPAHHYGTHVGNGMFALVPLHRGQFLFQFTGFLLSPETKHMKNDMRRDYSMIAQYGAGKVTVVPLNDDETTVSSNHFAGFINEPSPPPWKDAESVRVGGRHGIVRDYHFQTGTYDVEFEGGGTESVAVQDVRHVHPPASSDVYEANCMWYPFPVPLHDAYVPSGQRRGGDYVFQRTSSAAVRYVWKKPDILSAFSSFSDGTGIYKLTKSIRLAAGMMVYLKDVNVFPGLERYGLITDVSSTGHLTVTHVIASHTSWRLPQLIYAAKFKVCSTCKKEGDDAACRRCVTIPFPMVYACKNIRPDEELLCLYNDERDKERGIGCVRALQDDDFMPEWHH